MLLHRAAGGKVLVEARRIRPGHRNGQDEHRDAAGRLRLEVI
jgi:hypothetical protein